MKNTQFEFEDVFGDIISKDKFCQEEKNQIKEFFSRNNVNKNFSMKINLLNVERRKILIINRVLLRITNNLLVYK